MVKTACTPPGRLYFWTAASRTPTDDRMERESCDSCRLDRKPGRGTIPLRAQQRQHIHIIRHHPYQANSAHTSPVWRHPPLHSFDFHPQFTYVYPHPLPSEFEYDMKGTPPSKQVGILEEMVGVDSAGKASFAFQTNNDRRKLSTRRDTIPTFPCA